MHVEHEGDAAPERFAEGRRRRRLPEAERVPFEDLPAESAYDKALDKALKFLAPKARSRREVGERLRREGFNAELVARVDARLVELGILDDGEYARQMTEYAMARGQAPATVRKALYEKGVSREGIDAALSELGGDSSDFDRALELAQRRARSYGSLPAATAYRRLAGFLARKGYRPELVAEVTRQALVEAGID